MDPVTATGLVAAIIQLIGTTSAAIGYANEIRDASADRAQFAQEAASLLFLLTNLRNRLDKVSNTSDPWFASLQRLGAEGGPLVQLQEHMGKLNDKLRPPDGLRSLKTLARKLTWPLDKKEIERILAQIERVKTLISSALDGDHFNLSLRIKEDVDDLKDDLRVAARETATQAQVREDDEKQKVISWLSVLDSTSTQHSTFNRRQPGTGDWFIRNDAFKSWLDGGKDRILWSPGLPGAGKTSLASLVVNHLETHCQDKGTAVTYLYCNYKEQASQTTANLVAELLKHLVHQQSHLPQDVCSLYSRYHADNTRPKLEEVSSALHQEVQRYSRVFIVIDALDECPERNNTRWEFLGEVLKLPEDRVRLFCTSRHITSIENEFETATRLEIKATDEDVKRYVVGRIDSEVSPRRRRVLATPGLREDIINTVTAKSQGMFLLAQLHMESLTKKLTCRDVRAALASLPKELGDTYDQAMQRIKGQDEEEALLALRVLSWIIFAVRPLTMAELQHALAVRLGDGDLDREGLPDEESVLSVCAGLVVVEEESELVRLVHYTAQQYFERQDIRQHNFPDSPRAIAETCLTYLLFQPFVERYCLRGEERSLRFREYPFFRYAGQHWKSHARHAMAKSVHDLTMEFLHQPIGVISANQSAQRYAGQTKGPLRSQRNSCRTRLMEAIISEQADVVRAILDEGIDQDWWELDLYYREVTEALGNAALWGHAGVVKLLLEILAGNFADPDPDSDSDPESGSMRGWKGPWYGWAPLKNAIRGGHISALQVLIRAEEGDEPTRDPSTKIWDAALRYAVLQAHDPTVSEWLLGNGANLGQVGLGKKALREAVSVGDTEMISLLLAHGVAYDCSMLCDAVQLGNLPLLEQLIATGVDISSVEEEGQTVLHAASVMRPLGDGVQVLQFLLENGCDPLRENSDGETSLSLAMRGDHQDIVKILLEHIRRNHDGDFEKVDHPSVFHARFMLAVDDGEVNLIKHLAKRGADIDLKRSSPFTPHLNPLHRAVAKRSTTVMSLLLSHGSNVEFREKAENTPLHLAAMMSYEEGMRCLLDHGADLEATGDSGNTPLHFAARYGSLAAVRLLVDKGACLESLNGSGLTPLLSCFAIHPGMYFRIRSKFYDTPDDQAAKVEFLIERGADISGEIGERALFMAVDCKVKALVRLFLSKGVDPNNRVGIPSSIGHRYPPLLRAVMVGDIELVRLLLDYGAEVNVQVSVEDSEEEEGFFTPLHHAVSAFEEDTALVRLLLDKGADPLVVTGEGMTMLHHFIAGYHTEGPELVDILVEYGVDLNARCGLKQWTVFHYAVQWGKFVTLRHLVQKGVDIEAKDGEGMTGLDIARKKGLEMVAIFLTSCLGKKEKWKGG